jgi:hypothetical protein
MGDAGWAGDEGHIDARIDHHFRRDTLIIGPNG